MADAGRLKYVLEHVERLAAFGPDELGRTWDQDYYFVGPKYGSEILASRVLHRGEDCGTRACFAGWALLLHPEETRELAAQDRNMPVWEAAQKLLGLSDNEQLQLFYGCNSLADLREIVGRLADEAPQEG